MIQRISNERGSTLLMALSILGMLCIIGMVAVNTSTTDVELSFNHLNSEKAFYIAEAGAMRAFAELEADSSFRAGYSDIAFNDGLYSVTLSDSTADTALHDTIIVTSSADLDGSGCTVELTLVPEKLNPFDHAMFGDNTVDIKNSMYLDSYNSDSGTYAGTMATENGDVGSNGQIWVRNSGFVGGNVSTSLPGGLDINAGATVTGYTSDAAPEQELPEIPASLFTWAETNSIASTGITGSYTYNSSTHALSSTGTLVLSSGVYFFSDITLSNSADLQVAAGATVQIYMTGDIEMKNSSAMNSGGDPGDLQIYSQGDLVLKNSGDMSCCFYSPDGSADLRNSGEFFGSIGAEDIICHNSATFHYDRSLGAVSLGTTGEMLIVGFREID